jgi:hypothetical protein
MALLKRAENGDKATLPALRNLVKRPEVLDICGGDLARQVESSVVRRAAGTNLAFQEALFHKLHLLRAELTGPDPTPLERLLAERAAACWVQLHYYEVVLAQQEQKLTLTQGDYYHRRCERAQRRYLSALKTLALVRKLALPVLQVNIARRQVNVAAPAAVPAAAVASTNSPA